MCKPIRPTHLTLSLTGERAQAMADRLLDGRGGRLDLILDELAARAGRVDRVTHDWDPAGRALTLEARGPLGA